MKYAYIFVFLTCLSACNLTDSEPQLFNTNNGVENNKVGSESNNRTTNQNSGSNNTTNSKYEPLELPGGNYFGSPEKFNTYYTDPNWTPKRVIFVSMNSGNSNFAAQSYDNPVSMDSALSNALPGDLIFVKATPTPVTGVNIQLNVTSGTSSDPIVFYGERTSDGGLGVHLKCSTESIDSKGSCFNIESSSYFALDGFILEGGRYGVRTGGVSSFHQSGITIVNSSIFDQKKIGIFAFASDWLVVESSTIYGVNDHGGHAIKLTYGSDWIVIRYNELFNNAQADIFVDSEASKTCEGLDLAGAACSGRAENGQGLGVCEFFTISHNFFHNGEGDGPNFISMRNSKISENIFGPYEGTGVSFWQKTSEPSLGSSNNTVSGNLFVGTMGHLVQFASWSNDNLFSSNILLALNASGTAVNTAIQVIENGDSESRTTYSDNFYFSGVDFGHTLEDSETHTSQLPFDFFNSSFARIGHPEDWTPKEGEVGGWKPPVLSVFPSPYSR